jgi:hypothetical protein
MGLSETDAQRVISGRNSKTGATDPLLKPSYYATLQTLSQALEQNPEFYIGLYDTPTNVKRKAVAMQAVNLLLDRETYNSELREEAVLSQILETEVSREQDRHENAVNNMKRNERTNPAATPTATPAVNTPVPNPSPAGMTLTP